MYNIKDMLIISANASVNKFMDNLKSLVEQVISKHEPLKVTRRAGEAFVIVSAEDWGKEQETLHVLQNQDLMQLIVAPS
jgi:antitoxin YefM